MPVQATRRMRVVPIPPGLCDRDAQKHYRFRVLDWMACMFVHENWKTLGAAQMWSMLNRDRNGKLYLRQMAEFLPIEALCELSRQSRGRS